jgi:hypothetical protein
MIPLERAEEMQKYRAGDGDDVDGNFIPMPGSIATQHGVG